MTLNEIAKKMCSKGKGILAADESTGTIAKRFKSINVENLVKNRLNFRQTLFNTNRNLNHELNKDTMDDNNVHQIPKNAKNLPLLEQQSHERFIG